MPRLLVYPNTARQSTCDWAGPQLTIGRLPGNNIIIDETAVSSFHAKIERRDDGFWLLDLHSTNGTFVNGKQITEALLESGDEIRIGEVVPLHFEVQPGEFSPVQQAHPIPEVIIVPPSPAQQPMPMQMQPSTLPVAPQSALQPFTGQALVQQGSQCPACGTMIPFSVNFCPRCGFSIGQPNLPAFPMQQGQMPGFVRPQEPPGGGVGMLPLVALLCGLSIIGFPFAIILGLVALAQIRRQGGFSSDRKQAIAGIFLGVFWLLVVAGLGAWWGVARFRSHQEQIALRQQGEAEKVIAENETIVLSDLKSIARAQKLAKAIRIKDPQGTGNAQYLTLPELGRLGTTLFFAELASGKAHGYQFKISEANESDFTAVAEPEIYGKTGKRTFTVDSTGLLRGDDLQGKSFAQAAEALPILNATKTAFDEMDDTIAKEAIAYAKRLANAGQYEECRKILDTIPEQFAMTSAAQELTALKKSVDPFIVEAQAQGRFKRATTAAQAGDYKLAIGLLKDITELYPSYTQIAKVTDTLNLYQTTLAQKLDGEAKALFDQAEALERDNQPEAALERYVQIEKNYTETEWAKRIIEQKPALQRAIREKGAEQLFAQARNLSLADGYREIVSTLEQLMRNYSDTTYVQQNSTPIVALFQKALAQQYRAQALAQMSAGRDADALARLEEACANNTDLRPGFKDLFLKLYLRVGQKRMEEGDQREALKLYRNYLALEPAQREVSPTVLAQLNYAVAKSEFALGHFAAASQNLVSARPVFEQDPEYNSLFGSVEFALGHYDEAIAHFERTINFKPNDGNAYARRGYTQIVQALTIEQQALTAFAGYLGTAQPTIPGTNTTPAADTEVTNTSPVFATLLPATAIGLKPEAQIKYDALASQNLLDEILDILQQIQEIGRGNDTTRTITRPISRRADPSSSQTQTQGAPVTVSVPDDSNARKRINRIRTGVEFGNAISAIHQKILDNNSRKTKGIDALRRMTGLLTSGNRDLTRAIQLGADRAPDLTEVLKATRQHETRINDAALKISAHLAAEIDVLARAYQIAEQLYRNMRIEHIGTPTDPTVALDMYFTKLFDRRDFDQGIQRLREAAGIKVPLETYNLLPASAPAPLPPPVVPAKKATPVPATPPEK